MLQALHAEAVIEDDRDDGDRGAERGDGDEDLHEVQRLHVRVPLPFVHDEALAGAAVREREMNFLVHAL